jgi:lysine/ornithine N-monooxygenase
MTADFSSVAVVGAGPYGLSIASHLRALGIEFRIFGTPMQSWRTGMPTCMFLKSAGFASNLSDPQGRFTLQRFCHANDLPYEPFDDPVPLETFTRYGLAFQRQFVPNLEGRDVIALEQSPKGFLLRLDNGKVVETSRVILAIGITHFAHVSAGLAHLPPETVSHSSDHHDVSRFRGREVSVFGAGASALELAAALFEAGSDVRLIARRSRLSFNVPEGRSSWGRWRPRSGLGYGWRNHFYERAPMLFRRLPPEVRTWIVRTALGPAGGAPVKERIERVPILLGHTLKYARFHAGRVDLRLLGPEGEELSAGADHVIAATGYRVDLRRLPFLDKKLRSQIRCLDLAPVLSPDFESSVPGLYFAGLASAHTFGPMMRFVLGARYTADRLGRHLAARNRG